MNSVSVGQGREKIVFATSVSPDVDTPPNGSTRWIGDEREPLQGSMMAYGAGKSFRTHRHLLNPRLINRTQECFVVIRGKVQVDIYTTNRDEATMAGWESFVPEPWYVGSLTGGPGDAIFVWRGFHKVSILEDNTLLYEIKAGQLLTPMIDEKEYLDV